MQNSLHALKPQKNANFKQKNSRKKGKTRIELRKEKINNENGLDENDMNLNKPLFLFTDKKFFLLLKRTYYMKELEKAEKFINSERFSETKLNLTNEEFQRLVEEFNNLLNLQNLYISFEDLFKSLQLQNKIINILKIYITNKIEEK
jgi:hypothetical protein